MWQDWVLAFVQSSFVVSLLPTVFHPTQKPTFFTSVLTSIGMMAIFVINVSLSWWIAAASTATLAVLWATLAYQRWRLNRAAK